jgi:hypothetical protein
VDDYWMLAGRAEATQRPPQPKGARDKATILAEGMFDGEA